MEFTLGIKNLTPWKAGQSGNPTGVAKLPPELQAIKALTRVESSRYISKYARMSKEELEMAAINPKTTALELGIVSIFMKCIQHGDSTRLQFLLDQSIGKIPVATETDEEKLARQDLQNLSDQELIKLVKEKIPVLSGETPEK